MVQDTAQAGHTDNRGYMRKIFFVVAIILITSGYALAENTSTGRTQPTTTASTRRRGHDRFREVPPEVCFLNFDKDYKTTFTAVIFASDLPKFSAKPRSILPQQEGAGYRYD